VAYFKVCRHLSIETKEQPLKISGQLAFRAEFRINDLRNKMYENNFKLGSFTTRLLPFLKESKLKYQNLIGRQPNSLEYLSRAWHAHWLLSVEAPPPRPLGYFGG
jgi:hypothetical protein